MDPVEVKLPIHYHPLTPLKDKRRGNCCGIKFESITDGYYCTRCDYFYHERCSNAPKEINYPSHKCGKSLSLTDHVKDMRCLICREKIDYRVKAYECYDHKDFVMHMECLMYPPPEIINVPQNHDHKLKLEMVESCFTCAVCGNDGDGYSYKCHECDLKFHVNCKKYAAEVNHLSHSLHSLKLFNGEPPAAYSDGKCSLCGKKLSHIFYHCSACKFSLDLSCVLNPPPLYHHDLNIHDHELTLLPKSISFTCTTCGLNGDRSPYVCLQCNFTAHNDCSGLPWVININRHDHRVSRTSLIGVVNSVCGVCQKKMDWSCGGYSCQRCPSSVFHTKCATRKDVWDGVEMKDVPEEDEDTKPFKVIDENTIWHFQHGHHLRLDKSGIFVEERSCEACSYPIYHHSFYSCMSCNYMLHESCAIMPKRKRHMVSNKPYILNTTLSASNTCDACGVHYNAFKYGFGYGGLDIRCASVYEPFVHKSHPHPLFYTSPRGVCSVCNKETHHVLRCVEDDCGYMLDFKCALLPYEVKHRVDDHFLSLCYGENANGKYWCDICEEETDPTTWFYTCEDCGVTLHTDCVLGDSRGLRPGSEVFTHIDNISTDYKVVRNKSMSRPRCSECTSRCIFPLIFKPTIETSFRYGYYCSVKCTDIKYNN